MIGGVIHLGGLPGLLDRVTLSAGVAICYLNVSRWSNPPSRGRVHITFANNLIPGSYAGLLVVCKRLRLGGLPHLLGISHLHVSRP